MELIAYGLEAWFNRRFRLVHIISCLYVFVLICLYLYVFIIMFIFIFITGGNTGIGRATATELAKRGGRIFIGCRDKKKGDAVVIRIRQKSKNPEVFCQRLDLASLSSIKDFAEDFNRQEPTLHILINNAGKFRGIFFQCAPFI